MQIKEEKLKQEQAAEECGTSRAYYPPSPQYKSACEEDPPSREICHQNQPREDMWTVIK